MRQLDPMRIREGAGSRGWIRGALASLRGHHGDHPARQGRVGSGIAVRSDVGVSFGLAAVAGLLVIRVADRWRRRYVAASLVIIVGQFFVLQDFTALGHVTAWLIGLAVAVPVGRVTRTQREGGP